MAVSALPCLLMLPLMTATVCFLPVFCQGVGEGRTFWVASNDQDLCGEDMVPCKLLEEYQANSGAIFSTSHSTWIFLKGKHYIKQQSIVVSAAENITWRGMGSVGDVVLALPACYLLDEKSDNEWDRDKYELDASVVIEGVKNFTMQNISLESYEAGEKSTLPSRYALILTDTADSSLTNIDIVFHHHSLLYGIQVLNPSEEFTLEDSQIVNAHITITLEPRAISYGPANLKRLQLSFHRLHSLFSTGITFGIADNITTTYISASVVLNGCTFTYGYPSNQIGVTLRDYPTNWFSLEVTNCIFEGSEGRDSLDRAIPIQMTFSLVQRCTDSNVVRVGPHVYITNSTFTNNHGGVDLTWQVKHESTSQLNSSNYVAPAVTIANCEFSENVYEGGGEVNCIVCAFFIAQQYNRSYDSNRVAFNMQNCSVHHSKIGKPPPFDGAVIAIKGFFRVKAGSNTITSNQGLGMYAEGSILEIHGYNEISHSEAFWEGGGLFMAADSQLLLAPNAYLKITENKATHYGGGIYVSHDGLESPTGNRFLNDFVACYVSKTTCPGLCFFQFIGTDGQAIQSKEELRSINATINVTNNIALEGGTNIFNGHFENCQLQTLNGLETINRATLRNIFTGDVEKEELPMSFPYKICLCRPTPKGSSVNVHCERNVKVKTYAVEKMEVMLSVLGDMSQRMPAITYARMVHQRSSKTIGLSLTREQNKVHSCDEAFQFHFLAPGESYAVNVAAGLAASTVDPRLLKMLTVEIDNSTCPPGMAMKDVPIDSIHAVPLCQCSPHLTMHGISCTVYLIDTTYKAAGESHWIGMKAGQLFFSDYCPYFFCNDFLIHNELALIDINKTQQCVNGRRGLMCSECPDDTSTVFGSVNCKICSHWWLLLVAGFIVSGIMVVVILLVLNLTILQGSITGAIFYLNTTYLFNDFVRRYATGIVYFLLSILNFGIGFEVCFFDGMDEFWKAVLLFAFPFYLFALLIVLITVTQKCGHRMFKARFIARRAVPVLATIMLLTYTDLVTVVTVAIQPNTLYNAETGYSEKVWLYQPSLPYFSGQHLVLGILSIVVAVFYLIPFTVVMLFGDLMRRCFHKLWFSHFMDVLHGAFTWPLGFWIGFRMLIRILFIAMNTTLTSPDMSVATLWGTGTVLIVQLLIRPFKKWKETSHSPQYQLHSSTAQHGTVRVTGLAAHLKLCARWLLEPEVFDILFLLNTMLASSAALYSSTPRASKRLIYAMVNTSILIALFELLIIVSIHVYKFFPLSEAVRSRLEMCWGRMKAMFRQKRESEIVENIPVDYPLNDPIAVGIYELRPPEQDYVSEDESVYSSASASCQDKQASNDWDTKVKHTTSQSSLPRQVVAQPSSTTCELAQRIVPVPESGRGSQPTEQGQQLLEPLLTNAACEASL